MDRTGTPANCWLLCLMYVVFILNNVASKSLNWNTPLFCATGQVNDISPMLRFSWWEPVYYYEEGTSFPSASLEGRGHFVGIAEHVGHAMTFKVLPDGGTSVLTRSVIHSALDPDAKNLRLDPINGEVTSFIKSASDSQQNPQQDDVNGINTQTHGENPQDETHGENPQTAGDSANPQDGSITFDTADLVGHTFLMPKLDNGERHRARIVQLVQDHESQTHDNPGHRKFVVSVNDDEYEEVVTYNEIPDYLSRDENDPENVCKFRCITAHQGPLKTDHPDYNGSKYNVMIEWENGEITSEPLTLIAADDPVTCTLYARDNDLLEVDGWKRFKRIA